MKNTARNPSISNLSEKEGCLNGGKRCIRKQNEG